MDARGGFILPTKFWPLHHFAYKIGKFRHRQNDREHKLQNAYVSFGTKFGYGGHTCQNAVLIRVNLRTFWTAVEG
jgi:hypothetical protein